MDTTLIEIIKDHLAASPLVAAVHLVPQIIPLFVL